MQCVQIMACGTLELVGNDVYNGMMRWRSRTGEVVRIECTSGGMGQSDCWCFELSSSESHPVSKLSVPKMASHKDPESIFAHPSQHNLHFVHYCLHAKLAHAP